MKKIISMVIICFLLISFVAYTCHNVVRADALSDIFNQGKDFLDFSTTGEGDNFTNKISELTISFGEVIQIIGNVIIFICGAILGAKYMWSAASDKADAKGGLITFAWGVAFFYCATGIYNIASGALKSAFSAGTVDEIGANIYVTIRAVIDVCCVLAVAIIGLRYMFSNADMKGELKKRFVPVVIGIALIFSTSQIIDLIRSIVEDVSP